MNRKLVSSVLLIIFLALIAVTQASSVLSIGIVKSGLMSSAALTHTQSEQQLMANQTYWIYRGDAPEENAPYAFSQGSSGLQIGVQAPSMGTYAGYFAVSPAIGGDLFHVTITTASKVVPNGAFESAIYEQTADGDLDYLSCGSATTSAGTKWEVVYAMGNEDEATSYKTLWIDNAPNQPLTENCTIITNGKNYLEVYLDNSLVYSNSSLSLDIPSPFLYFLEPESSYSGSMLYSTFKDYYVASGETLQVTNLPSSASQVELVNAAGDVIASAQASNGDAAIEIAQFNFPLNVFIEAYDSSGNLLASTPSVVGLYGGDIYSVSGSPQIGQTSGLVLVGSVDQNNNPITGYYTVLSQGSQTLATGFTSASFQTAVGKSYTLTLDSYGGCTFSHWEGSTSSGSSQNFVASASQSFTGVYNCAASSGTTSTTVTTTTSSSTTTVSSSSSVTVNSVNEQNQLIFGYYTTLSSGAKTLGSGFTPTTFQTVSGDSYSVLVDNYGSCNFAYWSDTDGTNPQRSFTAQGAQTFTAVYKCS